LKIDQEVNVFKYSEDKKIEGKLLLK